MCVEPLLSEITSTTLNLGSEKMINDIRGGGVFARDSRRELQELPPVTSHTLFPLPPLMFSPLTLNWE